MENEFRASLPSLPSNWKACRTLRLVAQRRSPGRPHPTRPPRGWRGGWAQVAEHLARGGKHKQSQSPRCGGHTLASSAKSPRKARPRPGLCFVFRTVSSTRGPCRPACPVSCTSLSVCLTFFSRGGPEPPTPPLNGHPLSHWLGLHPAIPHIWCCSLQYVDPKPPMCSTLCSNRLRRYGSSLPWCPKPLLCKNQICPL